MQETKSQKLQWWSEFFKFCVFFSSLLYNVHIDFEVLWTKQMSAMEI